MSGVNMPLILEEKCLFPAGISVCISREVSWMRAQHEPLAAGLESKDSFTIVTIHAVM
jgi:hypothetical protein